MRLLYVHDVIALMGPFPGRDFKMAEIVRYVSAGRSVDTRARRAMRKAVARALAQLSETGTVEIKLPARRGGTALYRWKGEKSET